MGLSLSCEVWSFCARSFVEEYGKHGNVTANIHEAHCLSFENCWYDHISCVTDQADGLLINKKFYGSIPSCWCFSYVLVDDSCGCQRCCFLSPCCSADSGHLVPGSCLRCECFTTCLISFETLNKTLPYGCSLSQRGNQRVSRLCIAITFAVWMSAIVCLGIAWRNHSWLWLVSVFKYVPCSPPPIIWILLKNAWAERGRSRHGL